LIHYIHDGDNALARGEYSEAIGHYQAALEDTSLPSGLFWQDEVQSKETVRAYARFKLMVAYAASGNAREAQNQLDLLGTEYPQESVGYPYAQMGQAFWREFETSGVPKLACAAAVSIAEADPSLAERLYAGYANPEYAPQDLCRLPE
jgi:tetratricopeptide (TPR) repeat protein